MSIASFVVIFSAVSVVAFASPDLPIDRPLVNLTNDQDSRIFELGVQLNSSGALLGMFTKDVSSGGTDSSEAAEVSFPLSAIESSEGVVLLKQRNYNALLMNGHFDVAKGEGKFTVQYLDNGLTNSYQPCDFFLTDTQGVWAVQNAYTNLVVKAVRILTSTFGIRDIEGLCPVN
jgi:hypothetical protein